ncbi:MAG: hypothetical protein U0S48_06965 [Solirubrobacteraceae bacterium]
MRTREGRRSSLDFSSPTTSMSSHDRQTAIPAKASLGIANGRNGHVRDPSRSHALHWTFYHAARARLRTAALA